MTPSGFTYSLINVRADIARLGVVGGCMRHTASSDLQAQTCGDRHSLMRSFVGIWPTGPNSQAGDAEWGTHSRYALPH